MSYTAIANSEIDASSPLTETLMTKLRDNIKDHLHGVGEVASLTTYTAGDYLLYSNDTERITTSTTYIKLKEIKVRWSGTYRIKFDLYNTGGTGNAQLYKNGAAIGTERTATGTETTYSEDIALVVGDLIQVYVKYPTGGNDVRVNDFRIYCAEEGGLSGY